MSRSVWILVTAVAFGSRVPSIKPQADSDAATVTTKCGPIAGTIISTPKGQCDAYLGVPFAAPPIGDLRWQKPQEPTCWTGVRNATQMGPKCIQIGSNATDSLVESEDCLFLNVFVPKPATSAKLPVMVFIHGGAFTFGSAQDYGQEGPCENLATRGVIIVIIQYRLFMYGFFSTGDSSALGNYGLWDQIEALKWVNANIDSFGGDPTRVTMFGQSAGAASVSYLTYTTAAEGLFQQSLAESGSAFSYWAAMSDASVATAKQLAQAANCTDSNSEDYVTCLRQLSTVQLQEVYNSMTEHSLAPFYETWAIRVDGELFTQSAMQELDTRRPSIIGVNSLERPIPNAKFIPAANVLMNYTLSQAIIENDTLLSDVLTQTARYVYIDSIGDRNDLKFVYEQATKINADLGFHAAAPHEATLKVAAGSPVWVYNFDYWSDNVFEPDYPFQKGAPHAHELCYLFLLPLTPETIQLGGRCPADYEGEYAQIAEYLGEMWTNFAINGDPSPKDLVWPRFYSLTNASAMAIRSKLTIESPYYLNVTNFWYGLKPSTEQDFSSDAHPDGDSGSRKVGPASALLATSLTLCIMRSCLPS